MRFTNHVPRIKDEESTLIILGNGPSLSVSLRNHPEEIKGKDLMAVNQFAFSEQYELLKPSKYVLLDIGFFIEDTIPRVREARERLTQTLIHKTEWPVTMFFPKEGEGSELHQSLSGSDKAFDFVFFNRTNVEGLRAFRHWAYRHNLGMPKPQNVLVGCIMLAVVMRYSRVDIYGADHSWLENIRIDDENRLISIEKHFYDKNDKGKATAKEHPETLNRARLHDYLYDLARTFSSYHLIRDFADSLHIQIVNSSEESYIDAFERRR